MILREWMKNKNKKKKHDGGMQTTLHVVKKEEQGKRPGNANYITYVELLTSNISIKSY